ncbi:kinase-like domain-containing protein [Hyaloraphidium curvatum]|nr:kinase-like domain-containing protein [Hyaloraphidium curvatum]
MGPRRDASSALPALPPLLSPSPIQSLWAGYGTLVRGRLPSGEPCVEKLVLPPSGSGVAHARRLRSYANEMWFYRDYAARLRGTGAEVAAVHGLEATEGRFRFVLEDLAVRFPGSREELDEREAKAVLSWLAAFHAAFVGNDGEGLWEQGTYWHLATRGDELAAIPNSHKELKSLAAKLDVRLRSDVPWRTLVHGDAKAENFLFSRDGSACAACDFQYAGRGLGVQDVAYVLASSVNAQLLAKKERDLLAFYHGRLVELARASDLEFAYPFERMMDDFEVALLDYARFLAGWGWWGNTRWIKSRTADIMKRRGAEIASWPEVDASPAAPGGEDR